MNDFVYTNSIGADGRQSREISPAGTAAYADLRTGVTLVQELNRIYSDEPSKPVEVLSFDNMQAGFDVVELDPLAAVLD